MVIVPTDMKRGASITIKALKEAGYVEYDEDKFGPKSRFSAMPKSKRQKKEPKIDPFLKLCEIDKIPIPNTEHKFHPDRKWRMDYAWPSQMVFLEVEGGVFSGGRHTRGEGFMGDMEKYNSAATLGWTLIRCVPADLKNGNAIKLIKETLIVQL